MADRRPALDRLMGEEGSRALHEEFILAEGGALPDPAARLERARGASARAWLRHLAHALEACWAGAPSGLGGRLEAWLAAHPERLEALTLEEAARAERRGRGDPAADARRAQLDACARHFAEGLGALADPEEGGPAAGRRLARWRAAHAERARALGAEAERAAGGGEGPGGERAREAAALWAWVRLLCEGVAETLPQTG
jgi:hypothetical protein